MTETRTLNNQRQRPPTYYTDARWKTWCIIGAVTLAFEGIAYLLMIVPGITIGVAPGNNLQYLNALASHPTSANFAYYMTLLADLAFIPASYALYRALRHVNRNLMLVATAVIWIYVVVDLLTFVPAAISLIALSQQAQTTSVLAAEHSWLRISD